MTQFSTIAFT